MRDRRPRIVSVSRDSGRLPRLAYRPVSSAGRMTKPAHSFRQLGWKPHGGWDRAGSRAAAVRIAQPRYARERLGASDFSSESAAGALTAQRRGEAVGQPVSCRMRLTGADAPCGGTRGGASERRGNARRAKAFAVGKKPAFVAERQRFALAAAGFSAGLEALRASRADEREPAGRAEKSTADHLTEDRPTSLLHRHNRSTADRLEGSMHKSCVRCSANLDDLTLYRHLAYAREVLGPVQPSAPWRFASALGTTS